MCKNNNCLHYLFFFFFVKIIQKLKCSMCPEPHDSLKKTKNLQEGGAVLRCAQQWNLGGGGEVEDMIWQFTPSVCPKIFDAVARS